MNNLSDVSETALITLRARVIESQKPNPVITDPVGTDLLQKIMNQELDDTLKSFLQSKLPSTLTLPLALRARKYDIEAKKFMKSNPDCLIVSLGAGFDTRYWRLDDENVNYCELDLPPVIDVKKSLLGDKINYEMMGASVLDEEWIRKVSGIQTSEVLFLAEGLFMYLPENDVVATLTRIAKTFTNSRIVMEMVNRKYTQGFRKKMVESKMKRRVGCSAGSSFQYGVRDAKELEAYSNRIKVVEEWSYFDDDDVKPAFLKIFRNVRFMSRAQWTIIADMI